MSLDTVGKVRRDSGFPRRTSAWRDLATLLRVMVLSTGLNAVLGFLAFPDSDFTPNEVRRWRNEQGTAGGAAPLWGDSEPRTPPGLTSADQPLRAKRIGDE
jgi:hypothetical protein